MTDTEAPVQPARLAPRVYADPAITVRRLEQRLYSPLCGMLTTVGYGLRGRHGARVYMASGELTNVHMLSGDPTPPRRGVFHLGGFGILPYEGHIKLLGETVERYAAFARAAAGGFPQRYCSYEELAASGEPVLPESAFQVFTAPQLARPGFPFVPFTADSPVRWILVPSLSDSASCWVPAQAFLLGYHPKAEEPRFVPSVTTGTAVHPSPDRALCSALEELVLMDAAIGHWHGRTRSTRIHPDMRTRSLDQLIARCLWQHAPRPEFHLLPSPDLPGFNVACLLRAPGEAVPRVVIGLGVSHVLRRAMYHAFLEAVGVQWLGSWVLISHAIGFDTAPAGGPPRPGYDLDSNVGFYATPAAALIVEARFADAGEAAATDLPADSESSASEHASRIVRGYAAAGNRLFFADLTTRDIQALNLTAMRVWSPDTLPLPLPAAPPAAHPRFGSYGGFARHDAHPYP